MSLGQASVSECLPDPPDSKNLQKPCFFHEKTSKIIDFSWFSLSELPYSKSQQPTCLPRVYSIWSAGSYDVDQLRHLTSETDTFFGADTLLWGPAIASRITGGAWGRPGRSLVSGFFQSSIQMLSVTDQNLFFIGNYHL